MAVAERWPLVEARMYSRPSLNRHLYKTDTSLKRTPRVGPCLSFSLYLTFYKTDISPRRTAAPVPKVSVLERVDCRGYCMVARIYEEYNKIFFNTRKHWKTRPIFSCREKHYLLCSHSNGDFFLCEDNLPFVFTCEDIMFSPQSSPGISLVLM